MVRDGDILSLDANGRVQLSNDANDIAGPAGAASNRRAAEAPLPQEPAGALIARIGNSQPIYLGGRSSLVVRSTGRLFLGVNDDHLADNTGDTASGSVSTASSCSSRARRQKPFTAEVAEIAEPIWFLCGLGALCGERLLDTCQSTF